MNIIFPLNKDAVEKFIYLQLKGKDHLDLIDQLNVLLEEATKVKHSIAKKVIKKQLTKYKTLLKFKYNFANGCLFDKIIKDFRSLAKQNKLKKSYVDSYFHLNPDCMKIEVLFNITEKEKNKEKQQEKIKKMRKTIIEYSEKEFERLCSSSVDFSHGVDTYAIEVYLDYAPSSYYGKNTKESGTI